MRMRRTIGAMAVVAVAMLAGAASASGYQVQYNPGVWTAVPVNGTLTGGPTVATLIAGAWTITCTSSLGTTLLSNELPAPDPFLPTFRVDALSWSGCTDNIPFVDVTSVQSQALPWNGDLSDTTVRVFDPEVEFVFSDGSRCTYEATTLSGAVNNAFSRLEFNSVPVTLTSGPCPTSANLTVFYPTRHSGALVRAV